MDSSTTRAIQIIRKLWKIPSPPCLLCRTFPEDIEIPLSRGKIYPLGAVQIVASRFTDASRDFKHEITRLEGLYFVFFHAATSETEGKRVSNNQHRVIDRRYDRSLTLAAILRPVRPTNVLANGKYSERTEQTSEEKTERGFKDPGDEGLRTS